VRGVDPDLLAQPDRDARVGVSVCGDWVADARSAVDSGRRHALPKNYRRNLQGEAARPEPDGTALPIWRLGERLFASTS